MSVEVAEVARYKRFRAVKTVESSDIPSNGPTKGSKIPKGNPSEGCRRFPKSRERFRVRGSK